VNGLVFASTVLGAYLLGAIPFGFIAGKLKGIDIRTLGSGNIGATNVGRALGRKSMLVVFALDVLKGYGPTLAAKIWVSRIVIGEAGPAWAGQALTMCAAAATILGHMFPVYLGFRGGKGVATGLGLLLAISFPTALAALGTWTVALGLCGYVSLASIVAAASYPVWFAVIARVGGQTLEGRMLVWGFTTLLCAFVVWKHRGNVARIMAGTEPKTGQKAAQVQNPRSKAGSTGV
jgi:glycerol-3-phosphate acyltransferase PlsY